MAELDRRVVARGKCDLPVAGRYTRPVIFKLAAVDTTVRKAVVFEGDIEPLAYL